MKPVTFLYDSKEAVGILTEDASVRPLPFADMNALIQAPHPHLLLQARDRGRGA